MNLLVKSCVSLIVAILLSLISVPAYAGPTRQLTLAERISYQKAIEEVYWRHRLWPGRNQLLKPAFAEIMPAAAIEEKVLDYLRKARALQVNWQITISPAQLQAEMERMAAESEQPELLQELFLALDNDPFIIAQCLARPALVERLIQEAYARTAAPAGEDFHHWWIREREQIAFPNFIDGEASYRLPPLQPAALTGALTDAWVRPFDSRSGHTQIWTGSELLVWGGWDGLRELNTGYRYIPAIASRVAISTVNAPAARGAHQASWNGHEMIISAGYRTADAIDAEEISYNILTESWGTARMALIRPLQEGCPATTLRSFPTTINGELKDGDCRANTGQFLDAFAFEGKAGDQLTMTLSSSGFTALLAVASISGESMASTGSNVRISFTLPRSGIYVILVSTLLPGQSGSYTLNISFAAENKPLSFELAATPGFQTVLPGQTVRFTINTRPSDNVPVSPVIRLRTMVTPASSNITASLMRDRVSVSDVTDMIVTTTAGAAPGLYLFTIIGELGTTVRTATVRVEVVAPSAADFTVSVDPATLTVARGEDARVSVNIDRTGGFADSVTITAGNVKGIKFQPSSQATAGANVSFTFKVKRGALRGRQQLLFTARDQSGRVRTGTLSLVVQ